MVSSPNTAAAAAAGAAPSSSSSARPAKRARYSAVVSASRAAALASCSGMPFGQASGVGAALTAGALLRVPEGCTVKRVLHGTDGADHDGDGQAGLHSGQNGSGSASAGYFVLEPSEGSAAGPAAAGEAAGVTRGRRGAAAAGPKVMASRATVAFPRLAHSEAFVSLLQTDVDVLLDRAVAAWRGTVNSSAAHPKTDDGLTRRFEHTWLELGWQYAPLAAGEEARTRRSFFEVISRTFIDRIRTVLLGDAQHAAAVPLDPQLQPPPEPAQVLRAAAALLALYVLWATCPPAIDATAISVRAPPSLFEGDGSDDGEHASAEAENGATTDKDTRVWKSRIGQGWKIAIEADVLAAMESRLPDIVASSLAGTTAATTSASPISGPAAEAELRAILGVMRPRPPSSASAGSASEGASSTATAATTPQAYGGAWNILPPTRFCTRIPSHLPGNRLLSQAQADRESRRWGALVLPGEGEGTEATSLGLSRSELVRATLQEHLCDSEFSGSADGAIDPELGPGAAPRVAPTEAGTDSDKRFKGKGSLRKPAREPLLAESFPEEAQALARASDPARSDEYRAEMAAMAVKAVGQERAQGVAEVLGALEAIRSEPSGDDPAHGEENLLEVFLRRAQASKRS